VDEQAADMAGDLSYILGETTKKKWELTTKISRRITTKMSTVMLGRMRSSSNL
jgi:hypothetical protein